MTADTASSQKRRLAKVILCIAIFAVAFGIRLLGIGWGLKNDLHNQSYHPDEPLIFDFVHQSTIYHPASQREYYNYGTLYYFVLRSAEAVGSAVGAVHKVPSLELADIRSKQQWDDLNTYSSQAIQWGRYASALAGAGTAVIVFLILAEWTTLIGGLAGAAFITFAPAHVEHSRFQTVDIISLFMVSLATLACLRLLKKDPREPKTWIWGVTIAAALAGCAASTRYSDILMLFPIWKVLGVQWWLRRKQGVRLMPWVWLGLYATAVAIVAFLLTTPGTITDTQYFLANQQFQAEHANTGHGLVFAGRPSGFIFHLYEMMVGITGPALVVGLIGLVYAAIRKHAWAWAILAYFVPYYITIGVLKVMFLRYDFPLYLGVAVGFGYAISLIQRRLNAPWMGRMVAVGLALVCLAGFENPQSGVLGTAQFTRWMTERDPRDAAGKYIKDLAAKNPGLDVGIIGDSPWFYSAAIIPDADYLQFQPPQVKAAYLAGTRDPHVKSFQSGPPFAAYATISSYEIEDGQRLKGRTDLDPDDAVAAQTNQAMWDQLNGFYEVDRVFGGNGPTLHDLEYVHPTIWVMKKRS